MAKPLDITKEEIVLHAVTIVNDTGWDSLNARGLAKKAGISTKPIYRLFEGMDEVKKLVYEEIYKRYDEFINSRIDYKKPLLTLCISYVEFAQAYKNLFISLFLSNNLKWNSVNDVLDEKWNQSTIINLVNKVGLSFDEAKSLFMDIWLYANGLATLVATNDIVMNEEEIMKKIIKVYKNFIN